VLNAGILRARTINPKKAQLLALGVDKPVTIDPHRQP
jgi:hypothetical protein